MTRSRSKNSKSRILAGDSTQREAQVAEAMWLALEQHPDLLDPGARLLLVDDMDDVLRARLARTHRGELVSWSRFCRGDVQGSVMPEQGKEDAFDAIFLRIPASKQAFEMHAALVAPLLAKEHGKLLVYGANDEGIKSCTTPLQRHYARVSTLDTRRHCRVLLVTEPMLDTDKTSLQAWRETIAPHPLHGLLPHSEASEWCHYPGVFAKGKLDEATQLLLEHLPKLSPGEKVLDFAAGPGAISYFISQTAPDAALYLSEADAIALHAARQNVPGAADHILSDGWRGITRSLKADLIVSNPPIHKGKSEDFTVLRDLITSAPRHLAQGGRLILVVQAQVPAERILEESSAYSHIEKIADNRRFRVWSAAT